MELSIEIILAALDGNEEALLTILKNYAGYINSFAYEEHVDEKGNPRVRIDPDTKQQLQEKLLKALKTFNIERALEE